MPLSRSLITEIRTALLPRVGNRATQREAILYAALGNSRVLSQIDTEGDTDTYVTNLIRTLEGFGRETDGVPTLATLLRYLATQTGLENAAPLNALADAVEGKPVSPTPANGASGYDEGKIIAFLEGLVSADLERILIRLPGASGHIAENTNHYSRVAALMRYVKSSVGPGVAALVAILDGLYHCGDRFRPTA